MPVVRCSFTVLMPSSLQSTAKNLKVKWNTSSVSTAVGIPELATAYSIKITAILVAVFFAVGKAQLALIVSNSLRQCIYFHSRLSGGGPECRCSQDREDPLERVCEPFFFFLFVRPLRVQQKCWLLYCLHHRTCGDSRSVYANCHTIALFHGFILIRILNIRSDFVVAVFSGDIATTSHLCTTILLLRLRCLGCATILRVR